MTKYLVTGGAGFIGSHLVRALLEEGNEVAVLDDYSTGGHENLPQHDLLRVQEGSLCDPDAVERALEGVEVVYHQAALPSVPRSLADPRTTCRINIEGTALLLHAAHRAGVRRVIGAGSSSVYGNSPTLPKQESMPTAPRSPYAVSKLAMEHLFLVFHRTFGLETVVLRYFNVFGPRQDPSSQYAAVIPLFIQAIREGKPPLIFGDGEQSRDFTYVANVVQANRLAAESPGAAGLVINVACGERHTVNRLAEYLGTLLGSDQKPRYDEERAGDVKHSLADIARARSILGYEPKVSFEEGLHRTVQWHTKRHSF